jgi:hypothetical protein
MQCDALTFFCAILQKALQTRDAASLAATEALQEASAAESVLRGLRQVLGARCIAQSHIYNSNKFKQVVSDHTE